MEFDETVPPSLQLLIQIEQIAERYESSRRSASSSWTLETFLNEVAEGERGQLLTNLIRVDLEVSSDDLNLKDYIKRFPNYKKAIIEAFQIAAKPTLSAGDNIGGNEIVKQIGQGGCGIVYSCLTKDGVLAALKIPFQKNAANFLKEADTAAKIDHPGIVTIIDFGVSEEHGPWHTMPIYQGGSLAKKMEQQLQHKFIVEVSISIVEALAHAHRNDVFHRDLKPSNILFDSVESVEPILVDFGLSVCDDGEPQHHEVAGSLRYMAPEQLRGVKWQDGRSDIWSFGVILYRMLTGRLPFQQSNYNHAIDEILFRDPRPPRQIDPQIPGELEAICLKCLQKDPNSRYATATDVLTDLRRITHKKRASYSKLLFASIAMLVVGSVCWSIAKQQRTLEPITRAVSIDNASEDTAQTGANVIVAAQQVTNIFRSTGDAWIGGEKGQMNGNTGSTRVLQFGINDEANAIPFLLKFEIPNEERITKATLRLYVDSLYDELGDPTPLQVNVHRVLDAWDEGSGVDIYAEDGVDVTWNQPRTGEHWTPGAKYSNSPLSPIGDNAVLVSADDEKSWIEIPLRIDDVSDIEHGVIVIPSNGAYAHYFFSSRESGVEYAPQLVASFESKSSR